MARHLFEFADLTWLPQSLRTTLREAKRVALGAPFRSYHEWSVVQVVEILRLGRYPVVFEIGADDALISHALAGHFDTIFVPSDPLPPEQIYQGLAKMHPGVVIPEFQPCPLHAKTYFPQRSLVILRSSFHHLSTTRRDEMLDHILAHDCDVLILEPLQRSLRSFAAGLLSFIPALASPVFLRALGGRGAVARRVTWTYLIPVVPLMMMWDAAVSSLRATTSECQARQCEQLTNRGELSFHLEGDDGLASATFWRSQTEVLDVSPRVANGVATPA